LHSHAPTITLKEAQENLPFPVEQFLKTVVFRIKNGDWMLARIAKAGVQPIVQEAKLVQS